MDLSKLSDQDLQALSSGNLSGMSDAGLASLSSPAAPTAPTAPAKKPYSLKGELAGYADSFKTMGSQLGRAGALGVKGTNDLVYGAASTVPDFAIGAKNLVAGTNTRGAGEAYKEWSDKTIAPPTNVAEMIAYSAPSFLAPPITKGMVPAERLIGRMGQGAGLGFLYGASLPGSGQDRLEAGAAGAAVGGTIPAVGAAAKTLGSAGRRTWDSVFRSEKGIDRLIRDHVNSILSKDAQQAVIPALRNPKQLIPDPTVTVAEAVSDIPQGAALREQQAITAASKGKATEDFNVLMQQSKPAVLAQAEAEREAVTAPIRDAVWKQINKPTNNRRLLARIDAIAATPSSTRSDVQGALQSWRSELVGVRDPERLYSIRKEISDALRGKFFDSPNAGKRYTGGELRKIQGFIDDEIKAAGGKDWDKYLKEFSARSKGIEAFEDRLKEMYKPAQRVNLGGGARNVAEESGVKAPQVLDRNFAIANWLGKTLRGGTEPRIDARMGDLFRNPNAMADLMDKSPVISNALSQYLRRASVVTPAAVAAQATRE